jgi:predicted RNase H-like HicB family nuclease
MTSKVVLEPSEDGGYTAAVPALPGCISEGDTVDEAMDNIREAIELDFEPTDEPERSAEGVLVRELTL